MKLPKLGIVKLIYHRPIPDGFQIQTATVSRKADGYYVTLSIQDDSVPSPLSKDDIQNPIGMFKLGKTLIRNADATILYGISLLLLILT